MDSSKIAIICDGKEVTYGTNLSHLFQYRSKKEKFMSSKCDEVSVEMYSTAVFRRASKSKKTMKFFVGAAQIVDSSYKKIFDKFGMAIYQTEKNYVLRADVKQLKDYNDFIVYANEKRNEYFELEKDYSKYVCALDANWIVSEFEQSPSGGLFGKKNMKIRQLYDCLAFVLYLDIFNETKE